jgi:hypothetical protein
MFRNQCSNRITTKIRGKSHGTLGIRNIAIEVIPLVFIVEHSYN